MGEFIFIKQEGNKMAIEVDRKLIKAQASNIEQRITDILLNHNACNKTTELFELFFIRDKLRGLL